ncbi:GAD-like domain-containing protein [Flexivirga meconopsidis]|uniref:GAD-like domain-containing protein n=1 Tax=Flexivirga meconopsidis TaxID=2977121 RepID=UPI00223FCAE5|nr:GAD-like domain-containing protein [Flexivirga meconopsidis]
MPDRIALQQFVDAFPPDGGTRVPTDPFLTYGEGHAPDALVELWRTHGLGWYGGGRIALVDPGEWMATLQTWFGNEVGSFPIAVTSFGHVYHYDRPAGKDRIQCLDPHFQNNQVVAEDISEFFNSHLPGNSSHLADLHALHNASRDAKGELGQDEIYYFEPMLAMGGQVRIENLRSGNGPDHLAEIHRAVGARAGA